MKTLLIIIAFAIISLGLAPVAQAGSEKQFACHVTSYNFELDRWEGKVISISVKAVDAHCAHGNTTDHYPGKVMGEAEGACVGEEGKAYDKCLEKYAVGAECGRDWDNLEVIYNLCGRPD